MPVKLEITKAPDKTVYEAGELFDPAGMELTATYADGEAVSVPVGEATFAPEGPLGFGDRTVTVSYNGVSAEQQIGFTSLFENTLSDCLVLSCVINASAGNICYF